MFNARIGFVPIFIYLGYRIVLARDFSFILRVVVLVLVVVFIFNYTGILEEYETTITWLMDGFTEITNLLSGKENDKVGNVDVLKTMIIIPQTLSGIIWGTGKDVYLLSSVGNSDIGYILQLNYGGVVYVVLLFLFIFSVYRKLKRNNIPNKWFNYVFLGTVLLCNVKGYFITTNSGMRTLMLLSFVFLLYGEFDSNNLVSDHDEEDISSNSCL